MRVDTGHALFSGHKVRSVLCLQLFHNSKTILTKITNQPECRRNKGNFLVALLLNTYLFFLLKRGQQCSQLLIREEAARSVLGKEVDVAKVTQTLGTRELAPGKTKAASHNVAGGKSRSLGCVLTTTGTTHDVCLFQNNDITALFLWELH